LEWGATKGPPWKSEPRALSERWNYGADRAGAELEFATWDFQNLKEPAMRKLVLFTFVTMGLMTAGVFAAEEKPAEKKWEVVKGDGFGILVPNGWRDMSGMTKFKLHRTGDGIGVPLVDDTGAPLQVGMTVEKFGETKQTLEEGAASLVEAAKKNKRLEMVGKETTEKVTLSDKTEALLLTTEFIKEGTRQSLQMKMLVKDAKGNGWVVSGFVVGGKGAKLATKEGEVGVLVKAYLTSFVLDAEKLDEGVVKAVYEKKEGKSK
jgi:hypothetical protein